MENVLIAIHDSNMRIVDYLDNMAPKSFNYKDDGFDINADNGSYKYTFTVDKFLDGELNPRAANIKPDMYFSFMYDGEVQYFNVLDFDDTGIEITVTGETLNLALLYEIAPPFEADKAYKINEYISIMGINQTSKLEVGYNELADAERKLVWTGESTVLERVLSLVTSFDGESKFRTTLNQNGEVDTIYLDIYKRRTPEHLEFGIGHHRKDVVIHMDKYGDAISSKATKRNLFNAMKIIDKDGNYFRFTKERSVKNEEGRNEIVAPRRSNVVYAPLSMMKYPSLTKKNQCDNWIEREFKTEYTTVDQAWTYAVQTLQKYMYPEVTYTIPLHAATDIKKYGLKIGDTIYFSDPHYFDKLILMGRITAMYISFTDPTKNTITLSNFIEIKNKISKSLKDEMNEMKEEIQPVIMDVSTTGVAFVNGTGYSLVTPTMRKGSNVLTENVFYSYYINGVFMDSGATFKMTPDMLTDNSAVLTISGMYGSEKAINTEVTFTNTIDGSDGKDGVSLSSVDYYYLLSNSQTGITSSTDGWTTTISNPNSSFKYLWTYRVERYSDATEKQFTPYVLSMFAKDGTSGSDGAPGKDGKGMKATTLSYALSANQLVIPSVWLTNIPPLVKGQYLWTKELWTYTDDTQEVRYTPVYIAKDGNNGTDGIAGKDGVSVEGVTPTYASHTSATTPPTAGWTTTIPVAAQGSYLWTKNTYRYSDNTTEDVFIATRMGIDGVDGVKGKDGLPGKDGVGVKSTIVEYGVNLSPTEKPTAWTTNVASANQGFYVWTRTTWTYTDNTQEVAYQVSRIGVDGATGADGIPGKAGTSITSTVVTYAASASGTNTPSTWSSTIPSVPDGQYLWTRMQWKYSDATSEYGYTVGKMGATGAKGADGVAGKDGIGIKTTVITYGLSVNETTQPTTWTTSVPTLVKGQFLWTKTVWTYTDSTTETGYVKTYIAKDGNNGTNGIAGKDGVGIKSTIVTYQAGTSGTVTPTGTWTSTVPNIPSGQFLWTKTVWAYTDNTNETGYSVSKMGEKGDKGDQGVIGPIGADGQSSYAHIAYATNSTGTTGFSVSDNVGKTYIGMYVDNLITNSTDPTKYKWNLIKGADGTQGIQGKAGVDGKTPYWHTAYANSADGKTDFSLTVSDGKRYIGQYTDYLSADSTDPTKYKWVDMVGSVESGGRNYFKNSRSRTYTITSDTTQDYRTFIYDEFWKNDRRFIKSMVRISLDIAFSPALPQDISTRVYFSASPWYSAPITFKGNTTDRQHFDLVYDLRGTTNTYKTDNVFIRFNNSFPLNTLVSIDNANLYISSVREDYKPAPEYIDAALDTKANEEFTIEQLNLLAENQSLLKAENDAKASMEEVQTRTQELLDQIKRIEEGQKVSEQTMISNANRVVQILAKLGDMQLITEAITQYMSYSDDGLVLKMKNGASSVRVTTDRISFYSGGTETAFISQGFLQIESGVFTLRLQIGRYLFEEDAKGMLMVSRVI